MTAETIVYIINLSIAAILAALLTQYWWRAERESGLGLWAVGAWTMAVADALFALRPLTPYEVGRFVPTLLVTVGMALLLVGAGQSAGRRPGARALVAATVLHAALLASFLAVNPESPWRTIVNAMVWAGISAASFLRLRQAPPAVREALAVPAFVFLVHGVFQVGRATATRAIDSAVGPRAEWLQVLGGAEASLFMVALFVSLLAGHLTLRGDQLVAAQGEVKTLSGLLPICAWCRKIRDGDGYWQQVERFFTERSNVSFTHSICESCLERHFNDSAPEPSPPSATRR